MAGRFRAQIAIIFELRQLALLVAKAAAHRSGNLLLNHVGAAAGHIQHEIVLARELMRQRHERIGHAFPKGGLAVQMDQIEIGPQRCDLG